MLSSAAIGVLALITAGCVNLSEGRAFQPGARGCRDGGAAGAPDPGVRPFFYLYCVQSP